MKIFNFLILITFSLVFQWKTELAVDSQTIKPVLSRNFYQISQSNSITAEDFFNEGMTKFRLKDFKGAIKDFNESIFLNPNFVIAYISRGNAYAELKEYEKAITNYDEAISLNPNLARAYASRGTVYFELKEYEKALADNNQAISINPNLAIAYVGRGFAYLGLREYRKAIIDLDKATTLFREQGNIVQARQVLQILEEILKQAQ